PLTLAGPFPYFGINVDNSADAAAHNNVTLDASGLSGLAPAAIQWANSGTFSVVVSTGNGPDTGNVRGTIASNFTREEAGDGNNEVCVGRVNRTVANLGSLVVFGGTGADTLRLEDGGEAADQTYTLGRGIFSTFATRGTTVTSHTNVDRVIA